MELDGIDTTVDFTEKDKSGDDVDIGDIRRRMGHHYNCDPFERSFHIQPAVNHYEHIGSVLFSLEGSPPKGYALYIGGNVGSVTFYNIKGTPYERWKHVDLEFDQP